ncbi:sulfatase-like hydrolase/transferase [Candidatus Gottesmanbacteria bacterium]|nr:sulfatase-like hydrolase/transferase [Candidatus Gottesmanbacteria bacterium]
MKKKLNVFKVTVIAIFAVAALVFSVFDYVCSADSDVSGKSKNIILFGWDGVQREHLMEMLAKGRLPNLQKLIQEGGIVNTEVTTGATCTKPGWTEILTGYSALRLGIPDNKNYRSIPMGYTIFERLKAYFGNDGIKTIFVSGKGRHLGCRGVHEICINCPVRHPLTQVETGWWDRKLYKAPVKGKKEHWVTRESEPYYNATGSFDFHAINLGIARNVGKKIMEALDRFRGYRFFAFFHFDEPDRQGHVYGENSQEYSQALEDLDSLLGATVRKLKKLGIYDNTEIFVTTDHGMDEGLRVHINSPHTFLAINNKRLLRSGDRKDITPTILEAYGISQDFIEPPLNGKSLFVTKDYNLIMISLSNVAAEHMSLYGYKRKTTPNLEKWARDAIVFENTFSQASWTLPVATSLFTSLYPYTHGVVDRYKNNILDNNIMTLPEVLAGKGYRTAAFTGGLDYDRKFGHMRGFKEIEEVKTDQIWPANQSNFSVIFNKGLEWLKKESDSRFFLFLHGYDAHCPFTPPEKFKGVFSSKGGKNICVDNTLCLRGYETQETGKFEAYYHRTANTEKIILTKDDIEYLEALYDEEILSVDSLVSGFLSKLGPRILDKTIIVIFSDHGEMFAKHGRFGRAGTTRGTLYDDVLHVPLIIKIPGHKPGVVKGLAQIIDVMPTLLDILNISVTQKVQGKNLVALIENNAIANEYVFAGSRFGGPAHLLYKTESSDESIRSDRFKLIREVKFLHFGKDESKKEETYELYDLAKDSDELYNVIDKEIDVGNLLKEKLNEWREGSLRFFSPQSKTKELPRGLIKELKESGYW